MPGKRKGWFIIPGVQDGDRTLDEQMTGITPALEFAQGKSVLDLGCAEGLVGREFARAGADHVLGVEEVAEHIEVGLQQCSGLPVAFRKVHLDALARVSVVTKFDIVLALGVIHKLENPDIGLRFAAKSAREWLILRLPAYDESERGVVRSKHFPQNRCDVLATMTDEGFGLERSVAGPRGERVHYWRRVA